MSNIDDVLENMRNPETLQSKINSPEGEVFKVELERYGRMIAALEYKLKTIQLYQRWKMLRYQEFLGYKLTPELIEEAEKLEEWTAIHKLED